MLRGVDLAKLIAAVLEMGPEERIDFAIEDFYLFKASRARDLLRQDAMQPGAVLTLVAKRLPREVSSGSISGRPTSRAKARRPPNAIWWRKACASAVNS